MFRDDTYCGLNCRACPVLVANQNNTVAARAAEWGMEPENLVCHGCKSEHTAVFCVKCEMRTCAQEKGIEFCFECDSFPCTMLVNFNNDKAAHHSVVLHNLNRIREVGAEAWLKEQKLRWQCPECGSAYTWYDEICSACGGKLFSCKEEAEQINNPGSESGL